MPKGIPRGTPNSMGPDDLRRILSNVIGSQPQIYLSVYDPLVRTFIGGPWDSVELYDNRLVILVKRRTTPEQVLQVVKDAVQFIRDLIPGLKGFKGERGFR